MFNKRVFYVIILILFTTFIYLNADQIQLKDGSIIKGSNVVETEDTVIVVNDIIGRTKISIDDIKYQSNNYNNGFMFYYSEISKEKGEKFDAGSMFSISTAGAYDDKISTCFDVSYFHRSYESDTLKFIHVDNYNLSKPSFGLVSSNFENDCHFIMPSLIFRMNVMPDFIQNFFDKLHLFPYVGVGGGYGLAILNYTRIDTSNFTLDGNNYSNEDIDYKNHYFGGFHYRLLYGVSYKFSTKSTLVFEFSLLNSIFEQFLTEDEKSFGLKKESYEISGLSMNIGIRFGVF